jgi:hypothetical protein
MIKLVNNGGGNVPAYETEVSGLTDISYQGGFSDIVINHNLGKNITRVEASYSTSDGWATFQDFGMYYAAGNYGHGFKFHNTSTNSGRFRRYSTNDGATDSPFTLRIRLYSSE